MLTSVIFDMDGVIVDSHPAHLRTWRKFLLSLGKSVTDSQLDFVRQGRKREEILEYFLGHLEDRRIQELCHEKDVLFRNEAEGVKIVPGILDLLGELDGAGIPMGVASCGSRARVHDLLSRLGLGKYFATVVTGDEVAKGKPDPEVFHKAAGRMRVHPAESVVFEDSVSGVQGAKAAGMKCVGIADHHQAPSLLWAGADHVFSNFSGLSWIKVQKLFALSTKVAK